MGEVHTPRPADAADLEAALEVVLGQGERMLVATHRGQWVVLRYELELDEADEVEVRCELLEAVGGIEELVEVAAQW